MTMTVNAGEAGMVKVKLGDNVVGAKTILAVFEGTR